MFRQPTAFSLYSAIFWLCLLFVLPVYFAEYSAVSNRLFILGEELMQDKAITLLIIVLILASITLCITAIVVYKNKNRQRTIVGVAMVTQIIVVVLLLLPFVGMYATIAEPDGVAIPYIGFLMPLFSIWAMRNTIRNIGN